MDYGHMDCIDCTYPFKMSRLDDDRQQPTGLELGLEDLRSSVVRPILGSWILLLLSLLLLCVLDETEESLVVWY